MGEKPRRRMIRPQVKKKKRIQPQKVRDKISNNTGDLHTAESTSRLDMRHSHEKMNSRDLKRYLNDDLASN